MGGLVRTYIHIASIHTCRSRRRTYTWYAREGHPLFQTFQDVPETPALPIRLIFHFDILFSQF